MVYTSNYRLFDVNVPGSASIKKHHIEKIHSLSPFFKLDDDHDSFRACGTFGYYDSNFEFYKAPIQIGRCEILEILFEKEIMNGSIFKSMKTTLKIYEDNFNSHIEETLIIKGNHIWVGKIISIINTINQFLFSGRSIEQLHFEKLLIKYNNDYNVNSIIGFFSKGSVKTYSNSSSRVGKDNAFWTEYEVTLDSSDKYLINLFIKGVNSNFGHTEVSNNLVTFSGQKQYFYSPYEPREFLSEYPLQFNFEFVKVQMILNYDSTEHKLTDIQK